jgi:hypothetical protein
MSSIQRSIFNKSALESFIEDMATLADKIEHSILEQYSTSSAGDSLFNGLRYACEQLGGAIDAAEESEDSTVLLDATDLAELMEPVLGSPSHQDVQGEGGSSLYDGAISEVEQLGPSDLYKGLRDLETKFGLIKNKDAAIKVSRISEIFVETEQRRREKKKMEAQSRKGNLEAGGAVDDTHSLNTTRTL